MSKKSLKEKIQDIKSVSSDLDYLKGEFNGKLYATRDGDVNLEQMLEFAIEYDYLLEHILQTAKIIKETIK
jgi:hypothetical protein